MELKITKGKWSVKTDVKRADIVVSSDQYGCICKIDVKHSFLKEEMNANAKLIAAAPEMLKSLQTICEIFEEYKTTEGEEGQTDLQIAEWFMTKMKNATQESIQKATE